MIKTLEKELEVELDREHSATEERVMKSYYNKSYVQKVPEALVVEPCFLEIFRRKPYGGVYA